MKLFISYARTDRAYCVQIVEVLDFHDVWYDYRLHAGQKWWKEILNRLEWCDGFIFLLSSASLESEYCQREFEIAQSLNKYIFPVIIEPNITIPETISHLQHIDFSQGMTAEAVRDLLRAIYIADQANWSAPAPVEEPALPLEVINEDAVNQLIREAAQAMEKGAYEEAVVLFNQVLMYDNRPRFINIEKLAKEAEAALERQLEQIQMERDYRQIVELVHLPATRQIGLDAFESFQKSYPDYDPEYLGQVKKRKSSQPQNTLLAKAKERARRVPMLEWCEIPGGMVRLGRSDSSKSKWVDSFLMARYPVTNRQYQAFLRVAHGYGNPKWWDYDERAAAWRAQNPQPRYSKYSGPDRPAETVNWYDARAFCYWLGDLLDLNLGLPTLQQRQRAVMGDDERTYPWGDKFDPTFCNTRESSLRMTTVVNRYPQGVSQYGVYDLTGNVWEWCIDEVTAPKEDSTGKVIVQKAIVHGGAFVSPYDRCQAGTFYTLPLETAYATIGFRLICMP